jgi:hypothetical protein
MGGQACVFYGAAEFSRDCDVVILCDEPNLAKLAAALAELEAESIAVPPFDADYLQRGHAVHFRCHAPAAQNIRLDVMSRLRGVDSLGELWARRTTLQDSSGMEIELMALPDLVAAKKTQRDKDWPMIRRLVESHYAQNHESPNDEQVWFWLRQARTPELLQTVVARFPEIAEEVARERPLLAGAFERSAEKLLRGFSEEERLEREADRRYWQPLKDELEALRRQRRTN